MERILDFIAKETDGKNYKSYKYCFESVEIPKLDYEDKKGITIRHLLQFRSGLTGPGHMLNTYDDPVAHILNFTAEFEPGTKYEYSGYSADLISAIISKQSNMSTYEFADEYLFSKPCPYYRGQV